MFLHVQDLLDDLTLPKRGEGGLADWISFTSEIREVMYSDDAAVLKQALQDIVTAANHALSARPKAMDAEGSMLYKRTYSMFALKQRGDLAHAKYQALGTLLRDLLTPA